MCASNLSSTGRSNLSSTGIIYETSYLPFLYGQAEGDASGDDEEAEVSQSLLATTSRPGRWSNLKVEEPKAKVGTNPHFQEVMPTVTPLSTFRPSLERMTKSQQINQTRTWNILRLPGILLPLLQSHNPHRPQRKANGNSMMRNTLNRLCYLVLPQIFPLKCILPDSSAPQVSTHPQLRARKSMRQQRRQKERKRRGRNLAYRHHSTHYKYSESAARNTLNSAWLLCPSYRLPRSDRHCFYLIFNRFLRILVLSRIWGMFTGRVAFHISEWGFRCSSLQSL